MSDEKSLWPLRLIALLIAFLAWLFASFLPRLENLTERELLVALNYEATPVGMIADTDRPAEVLVRVRGTEDDVGALSRESIRITVPLPESIQPGVATEIFLTTENAVLPEGVEVLSFSPENVSVVIDDLVEVQIRVLPEFRGEPGAGLTRENIRWVTRPEFVAIRGPRAAFNSVTTVATDPINVGGRAIDFSEQAVGLQLPNPSLNASPSFVTVDVFLEPEEETAATPDESQP